MFLLSLKFSWLIAATALLLSSGHPGGGFQSAQAQTDRTSCFIFEKESRKSNDAFCDFEFLLSLSITDFRCWAGVGVRTRRNPGYSTDCYGNTVSCYILFSDAGDDREVVRGCGGRYYSNDGILGKCVPTKDTSVGENAILCLCNNGDDCNKNQIDGMPPGKNNAGGTGDLCLGVLSLVFVVAFYINA